MSNLEDQLKDAKARFSAESAAFLAGDPAAEHRAAIACKDVRRLQAELKRRPAPTGVWAGG